MIAGFSGCGKPVLSDFREDQRENEEPPACLEGGDVSGIISQVTKSAGGQLLRENLRVVEDIVGSIVVGAQGLLAD